MSTFEVKPYKLTIEPHPNADKLELAAVGDYRAIVGKGQFKTGDLGLYIPEGAVVPDWMLIKMNLVGKLAGKTKNRVKAIKLRGILSQGLVYPLVHKMDGTLLIYPDGTNPEGWLENDNQVHCAGWTNVCVDTWKDYASHCGITKYEPPIPVHMAGEVFNAHGYTLNYDIENIKKFPNVLHEDEQVLVTEKLHGTWTCFGYHPEVDVPVVTSKGLSGRGLAFKHNEANAGNLYLRSLALSAIDGKTALDRIRAELVSDLPVYVLGETFGKGVQDLHYGLDKPAFRAFDIYVGTPGQGRYLSGVEFTTICGKANVETVPVLYHGPYTAAKIAELTDGLDEITGAHIREGVVIRPLLEDRIHNELGRVILKSVSEAYLLRGGETTELT